MFLMEVCIDLYWFVLICINLYGLYVLGKPHFMFNSVEGAKKDSLGHENAQNWKAETNIRKPISSFSQKKHFRGFDFFWQNDKL